MSWWQGAVLYQVYIRSFSDADGNGVGDLEGLRAKLPYVAELGVDGIWITPFFRSPMVDHGYDVSDPRDVDPLFGTLEDFDALVGDAHELGLRVLIDVVPNHTSDKHPWFVEALASPKGSAARDRYIFRDEPNNWTSVFGGSAWQAEPSGDQVYLHLFAPEQPDLNWRNPEVVEDAERTLRFWFDRGVDGFRIDVAHGLFKDVEFRDNPVLDDGGNRSLTGFARDEQRRTFDQEEVHDVYRSWCEIAASYSQEPVLLGEVFLWDPKRIARYLREGELNLAFSFMLLGQRWERDGIKRAIDLTLADGAPGATSTAWTLSNHDVSRHATRFGGVMARSRAAALLLLAMPGTVCLYYGEELGLEDGDVPPDLRQDPIWFRSGGKAVGRDNCRTPMPWTSDGAGAGFTTGDPWLPIPVEHHRLAVDAQRRDEGSILALYRAALALRRSSDALRFGTFAWVEGAHPNGDDVLTFERTHGAEVVRCTIDFANERATWTAPDGTVLLESS
jgi:alpha-glucosidase